MSPPCYEQVRNRTLAEADHPGAHHLWLMPAAPARGFHPLLTRIDDLLARIAKDPHQTTKARCRTNNRGPMPHVRKSKRQRCHRRDDLPSTNVRPPKKYTEVHECKREDHQGKCAIADDRNVKSTAKDARRWPREIRSEVSSQPGSQAIRSAQASKMNSPTHLPTSEQAPEVRCYPARAVHAVASDAQAARGCCHPRAGRRVIGRTSCTICTRGRAASPA